MGADAQFNEIIHAPLRLRACGILRSVDEIDFAVLRETLDISDASLSKHLKVLADNNFVQTVKRTSSTRSDSRLVTWVRLTPAGRKAFDAHVKQLQMIAAGLDAVIGS